MKKMMSLSFALGFCLTSLLQAGTVEDEIIRLTNQQRSRYGKPALKENSLLNSIARKHAENMAQKNILNHTLDGKGAADRLQAGKYQYWAYGENIAAGYRTAQSVMNGWMNSPGHKSNILDSKNYGLTEIGVGTARSANGTPYYCQVFAKPKVPNQGETKKKETTTKKKSAEKWVCSKILTNLGIQYLTHGPYPFNIPGYGTRVEKTNKGTWVTIAGIQQKDGVITAASTYTWKETKRDRSNIHLELGNGDVKAYIMKKYGLFWISTPQTRARNSGLDGWVNVASGKYTP